jgi:pimeloyl-ACP methyl ester carboxylesterase
VALTDVTPVATAPGRFGAQDRRAALAAPAGADGFSSRTITAGGHRLHVRQRAGDSAATPYLLLHGLAVSHRYLMPTARRLGPGAVHVPDLPGFGLSAKPRAVLDVRQHSDVVAALIDGLGAGPVALVGNSFGAQIAVEVALRRPDLVASLVLTGPTTDPAAATSVGQARRFLRDLAHEDWRQTAVLAADIRDAGPRRILKTLRYAVTDDIDAKLPAIRVPTLFVRGAKDRIVPQSWLEHAAARVPGARTLVIEGAAHNVVATAGAETAAAAMSLTATRRGI